MMCINNIKELPFTIVTDLTEGSLPSFASNIKKI